MFADVRRGLTIAAVVHGATVTDTDGNEIDTTEFFGPPTSQAEGVGRPSRATPTTPRTTTRSDAVSERARSGDSGRGARLVSVGEHECRVRILEKAGNQS